MARAVALGTAVPLPEGAALVPSVPDSPNEYSLKHPTRINKFSTSERIIFDSEIVRSQSQQWSQELEHDVESVFWLLIYWAMLVQPQPLSKRDILPDENINSAAWSDLTGDALGRDALVSIWRKGKFERASPIHSSNPWRP
jgi:hypothetical protein